MARGINRQPPKLLSSETRPVRTDAGFTRSSQWILYSLICELHWPWYSASQSVSLGGFRIHGTMQIAPVMFALMLLRMGGLVRLLQAQVEQKIQARTLDKYMWEDLGTTVAVTVPLEGGRNLCTHISLVCYMSSLPLQLFSRSQTVDFCIIAHLPLI